MRASDRAYRTLREDILQGTLEPGTVLGEIEQSARLGISRTPLREALGRLVADGLAAPSAGRGMVVTAASLADAGKLFDLRIALEVLAVRRAAETAADDPAAHDRFADLAGTFDRAISPLSQGADPTDYYALTQELDLAVDSSCGNAYLADSLRGVRVHLARLRRLSRHSPARLAETAREHAAIARAIADGNPELAAAATVVHLQQALAHLRTDPDSTTPPPDAVTDPGRSYTAPLKETTA
ncbi:GntR family transcriptional regulator [Brachybacterium tyrofermentans]|uniref:GntR family transcriptional regulator n=1 Tax=Brachybacterium tyrofermentans TaxID=47848 RepID=UPI001866A183|nr:GntR family transcriptional regulator [Brachybacterium tyrofermentans]